jgi:hypothetical protein
MKNKKQQKLQELLNPLLEGGEITFTDIDAWISEHPDVLSYSVWHKDNIFNMFFECGVIDDAFEELGKPSPKQVKELWSEFLEDRGEELYRCDPPSEWGVPYQDLMYDWLETKKGIEV